MISNIFASNTSQERTHERIGFDEIKYYLSHRSSGDLLINTLPEHMQQCLIHHTASIQEEISHINHCLDNRIMNGCIYIYGMNHKDPSVERKQKQLKQLGFKKVFVYLGGLFEWLLLQDIYGNKDFPTTSVQTDILQFKP